MAQASACSHLSPSDDRLLLSGKIRFSNPCKNMPMPPILSFVILKLIPLLSVQCIFFQNSYTKPMFDSAVILWDIKLLCLQVSWCGLYASILPEKFVIIRISALLEKFILNMNDHILLSPKIRVNKIKNHVRLTWKVQFDNKINLTNNNSWRG